MECAKCKGKMLTAKLSGDIYGIGLELTNKKRKFLKQYIKVQFHVL